MIVGQSLSSAVSPRTGSHRSFSGVWTQRPSRRLNYFFSCACGLFVRFQKVKALVFSRIQPLFAKQGGWRIHAFGHHTVGAFKRAFVVALISYTYKPLFQQLLSFLICTKLPGVYPLKSESQAKASALPVTKWRFSPTPCRFARASVPLLTLLALLPTLSWAQASSSKPTIYVSDFDLDVVPVKVPPNPPAAPSTSPARPSPSAAATKNAAPNTEDDPVKFAAHLVDLVSTDLVQALQNAGYSVQRLGRNQGRPDSGLQIRGLFAEVDKENHWRRGVIHTAADSGKFQLLVSVANLTKPEQALYEIAQLPGNENKPGAVITLSSYVPLEKFEIDKDANEDQIKRAAARVVSDLDKLLNANPAAVPK
jgi:Domain of unknown function (DUF4410)